MILKNIFNILLFKNFYHLNIRNVINIFYNHSRNAFDSDFKKCF